MSLCVCIQNDDAVLIGADTAVTYSRDGELFRRNYQVSKLYEVGPYLLFFCGDLNLALEVKETFNRHLVKTPHSLRRIAREKYNEYLRKNPGCLERLAPGETSKLSIVMAGMSALGKTEVTILNPDDDFALHSHTPNDSQTLYHSGGVGSDEALIILDRLAKEHKKTAVEMTRQVFDALSGGQVGGTLMMAMINKDGIKFADPRPIPEKITLRIYEEAYGAGNLTGSVIRTSTDTRRIVMDGNGFRSSDASGKTRISIDTNDNFGTQEMRYYGQSGSKSGVVSGTDGALNIAATPSANLVLAGPAIVLGGDADVEDFPITHTVVVGSGVSTFDFNGVNVVNLSALDALQSEVSTLSASISGKADKSESGYNLAFDPTTRNLKMFSRTGALLATVNVPA